MRARQMFGRIVRVLAEEAMTQGVDVTDLLKSAIAAVTCASDPNGAIATVKFQLVMKNASVISGESDVYSFRVVETREWACRACGDRYREGQLDPCGGGTEHVWWPIPRGGEAGQKA